MPAGNASAPSAFGEFEVERVLGEGGSATVYAARHHGLEIALKVLRADAALTERERQRFLAEADQLAKVSHPGVIPVLDAGTLPDGRPFLALPLLHGETLAARLARGPLPEAEALARFAEATDAVMALHAAGLLHRDIKPENLFLDEEEGRLVLLDFGIARDPDASASTATQQGQVRGTPAYMAPERFFGVPASAASEVYELAATLHVMLAGALPWTDASDLDARLDPPLSPLVSPAIAAVLRGALAVRAEARPQTVAALVAALRDRAPGDAAGEATRTLSAPAKPPPSLLSPTSPTSPFGPTVAAPTQTRRRRRAPGIAAAVALAAAGAGAFAWIGSSAEPAAVEHAPARRVVVVLEPRNVSGRAEDAPLAAAIASRARAGLAAGGALISPTAEALHAQALDVASPKGPAEPALLAQLHARLDAALVVTGSYVVEPDHTLRVSFLAQDAVSGAAVASSNSTGTVDDVAVIVSRAVGELRTTLGDRAPLEERERAIVDSLPPGSEAAKEYAEALRCARRYAYACAKGHLDRAVALAPTSPLVHDALAEAKHALGDDAGAKAEVARALELGGHLPEDQHLALEAHAAATEFAWPRAIAAYTALVAKHPEEVRYALGLADAQSISGASAAAFATLEQARARSADPRIDLYEATLADRANDFAREVAAAERVIRAADEQGERELGAYGRLARGWALVTLGKLDDAKATLEEALRMFSTEGNRNGTSRALLDLGTLLEQKGDYEGARKMYEDALRIARDLGNQSSVATVLLDLGQVLAESADPTSARARYEEALGIARAIGDINVTEETYVNLGSLASKGGDIPGARAAYAEALSIARAHEHHRVICAVLVNSSNLEEHGGEIDKAVQLATEGVAEARVANEPAMLNQALSALAEHLANQGDFDAALRQFDEIAKLQRAANDQAGLLNTETTRVGVLSSANRDAEAKALATATLAKVDPRTDPSDFGWLTLELAKQELAAHHFAAAAALLQSVSRVVISSGDASLGAEAQITGAQLLAAQGHLDRARAQLAKTRAEAVASGDDGPVLEVDVIGASLEWIYAHDRAARARLGELAAQARAHGSGTMARQAEQLMRDP